MKANVMDQFQNLMHQDVGSFVANPKCNELGPAVEYVKKSPMPDKDVVMVANIQNWNSITTLQNFVSRLDVKSFLLDLKRRT